MNKFYIFAAAFISSLGFAQQSTSFEAAEGFTLGTIHNQNGWVVTEGSDGFVTNQIITDETASEGNFSFKNANEPGFGDQWFPIFGAVKTFETPANHNNFTISYDVKATEKLGADFEFTLYAIDDQEEFVPIAGIGIENRGFIYMIKDIDYGFEYATSEWEINQWINIKIEVTATDIKYYVDNILQGTFANSTSLDILGFNMLHNNYGGDAYYDNIQITTGPLNTADFTKQSLTLYPNPATNLVSINSESDIINVEIFTVNGQKVLETIQSSNIDISGLSQGLYLLTATDISGNKTTTKLLKR